MIESLLALDAALFAWVRALPHPDWLNVVMIAATTVGRRGAIWAAIGAGLALRRRGHADAFWRLLLALLLTGIVVDLVVKPFVARPRPEIASTAERLIDPPTTYSFPSGHAAEAAAGTYALTRAWPAATLPLWGLAAVVAGSRLYLGVHYPLDVASGLIVGLACAVFVTGGVVSRFDRGESGSGPTP